MRLWARMLEIADVEFRQYRAHESLILFAFDCCFDIWTWRSAPDMYDWYSYLGVGSDPASDAMDYAST